MVATKPEIEKPENDDGPPNPIAVALMSAFLLLLVAFGLFHVAMSFAKHRNPFMLVAAVVMLVIAWVAVRGIVRAFHAGRSG